MHFNFHFLILFRDFVFCDLEFPSALSLKVPFPNTWNFRNSSVPSFFLKLLLRNPTEVISGNPTKVSSGNCQVVTCGNPSETSSRNPTEVFLF